MLLTTLSRIKRSLISLGFALLQTKVIAFAKIKKIRVDFCVLEGANLADGNFMKFCFCCTN